MKRFTISIFAGLLIAVFVSVVSFMIQVSDIRHREELARLRGEIVLICRLPAETATIHGALAFAIFVCVAAAATAVQAYRSHHEPNAAS